MFPRTPRRVGRIWAAGALVLAVATSSIGFESASSARTQSVPTTLTCEAKPWINASYQASSTPAALASLVYSCLKVQFPTTFRHDEVGIVGLNAYPWFQNVNEFGLTSTVQRTLARLGMPPITLQDGPGGIITRTSPSPTAMPNELALGATFDTQMAFIYGATLGAQAHAMGYDGLQAPDLNLTRVPSWGRASESLGESPVLAGEMGASEAVAIAGQHLIPVLKHFGPYSQETNRKFVNQEITEKAFEEVYVRPFTFALRGLQRQLHAGGHAVAIMCSYGNVNATKACRSPVLNQELTTLGINALVRSDLDVKVDPSALLLNGVDLIKPMDTGELTHALAQPGVVTALDQAVIQIFRTEFADGLVNGSVTAARGHRLTQALANKGRGAAIEIMQRAAVLLKNTGVLPLRRSSGRIAVIGDSNVANSCAALSASLARALRTTSTCTDDAHVSLPREVLYTGLPHVHRTTSRLRYFTSHQSGSYVLTVTTLGNTQLTLDGQTILSSQGLAEYSVQRTALVRLSTGRYTFVLTWRGAPPTVVITRERPEVDAAIASTRGAKVAIVVAYDLAREGMDRSSLDLPGAQEAVISAVAARVPTIVLLVTDGAVIMPWLSQVKGVLEVWNPTGGTSLDRIATQYVPAWVRLLDGSADPSGRLPETFPVTAAGSPMGDAEFWPGIGSSVNLNQPPDTGVGIGMAWYRAAGWPVLFPFGYGLSYTTYQLYGGSLSTNGNGLLMTVYVRDTGGVAGVEPIQLYADFPSSLSEPRLQLVGFGTVSFTTAQARSGTVLRATIAVSPDAVSVWFKNAMRVEKGSYCLEASTYDGDPHSWTTGPVMLEPGAGSPSVATMGSDPLSSGTCPS
ncbi:MAG TPA: glycoside hydrolase family 3 C-terminal domain-containing protein [Acidimicrobiales bacterium]|jgi:beta-glucosidase|nr:glycoside hydrolase family 3 C-terminal domain-containing protein [Acidimicrobiales bacterium]